MQLLKLGVPSRHPFKPSKKRYAGQSLEANFDECLNNASLGAWTAVLGLIIIVAHIVGPEYWFIAPVVLVTFGTGLLVFNAPKIFRLKRGLLAEREAGIELNELERIGARLIHDIQRANFNIDHLIITHAGVFVVETKYIAKHIGSDDKLIYKDQKVCLRGKPLWKDALAQTSAAKREIANIMQSVDLKTPIRSVVLYPGWWIEGWPEKEDDALVMNPISLKSHIRKQPKRLSPHEIEKIYKTLHIILEHPADIYL